MPSVRRLAFSHLALINPAPSHPARAGFGVSALTLELITSISISPTNQPAGVFHFSSVQDIRHTKGEEEVLLAWRPTWVKASEVPDLASVPWDCTRPAHYTAGAAQQGGASGSRQTARKTARGADSMDEPPAKRGPCLLYTSPSPRDLSTSRMPSSA